MYPTRYIPYPALSACANHLSVFVFSSRLPALPPLTINLQLLTNLRYARVLLLPGFFAPVQRYSLSLLCHSQPDGFTLSPPWSPPYSLTAWSSFCSRLCQPPVCRSGALISIWGIGYRIWDMGFSHSLSPES